LQLAVFHVQCSAHRQEGVLDLERESKTRGAKPSEDLAAHVDISALAMAHAGQAESCCPSFILDSQCQQQTTSGMRNSASAELPRNGQQILFALKFS